MTKVKRKILKRQTKIRRNSCLPCMGALNPSHRGMRRINPGGKDFFYNEQILKDEIFRKLQSINENLIDPAGFSNRELNLLNEVLDDFV